MVNRWLIPLLVLSSTGTVQAQLLGWAQQAGSVGIERGGHGVSHDSAGNVYVTGEFMGNAAFGPGQANETILNSSGGDDMFLAKYDSNGNLQWARRAGSFDRDGGNAVAVDSNDDIYVAGRFRFGIVFHDGTTYNTGGGSMFLAKYDSSGNLLWATIAESAFGWGVSTDSSGVYVTGQMTNFVDFGSGVTLTATFPGTNNAFVVRYDLGGNAQWAKQGDGEASVVGTAIASDAAGAVVTGEFGGSAAFASGEPNETALTSPGERDIFLARFFPDGTLAWAKQVTGIGLNVGLGVSLDNAGHAYLTGYVTASATFGPGEANQTTITSVSGTDGFVAKFDSGGDLVWVKQASGAGNDQGAAISTSGSGASQITGSFGGGFLTLGAGEANETILATAATSQQVFVAQFDANGSLLWAKQANGGGGPPIGNSGLSISLDEASGSSYMSGNFVGATTFGLGEPNETALTSFGSSDVFLAKYTADVLGPITSNVQTDPNPASSATSALLTALIDDSTTGASPIASAEYTLDGSAALAMQAADGSFNFQTESVTALLPPQSIGIHDICVRGTDSAGNVGNFQCIQHVVEGSDLSVVKTSLIVPVTDSVTNSAVAQSDQIDPVPADNTAVNVSDAPVGSTVTYTIVVTNQGPSDATNVIVDDNLPRNVRFTSVVPTQGSCTRRGRRITCNLGTLLVGGNATAVIVVKLD